MIAAIFMALSLTLYWRVRCTAALYCRLYRNAMHLLRALGLPLARHAPCQGPCAAAGGVLGAPCCL
jgi:hypothetical protein